MKDPVDLVDPDPSALTQVVAWEHAALVQQALAQLNDQCQRLLHMLFLQEPRPEYQTIAAALGIAVGSIGPIRARCLQRLRTHLTALSIEDAAYH